MDRISFITHKSKKILFLNFADCKPEEVISVMEKAKPVFAAQALDSVLVMDNVTNTHFNPDTVKALGEFMAHNKSYVKAAAVFGASDMLKIVLKGGERASQRQLQIFDTEEQAKDWLVALP